ncbi:MAG TPA: DNA-binding response regulator, partial [Sutterella sp.]|nr:DNA-binding response regulator [Sutterella sp.]
EQDSAVLRRGGEEISLTKKELGVLKMLIINKGRTVTKESLIVNIWGDDSDTTENNVEAYISFIRKKLKYLGSGVTVKNIQGTGYRIEEGVR